MKKIIFIIFMLFTFKTAIPQNITWIEKDGPWKPNVIDISIGENLMIPYLKAIYVATGYGLFKSTNEGNNWIKLFNENTSAVECLRDNPQIVYVAKQNIGLFKSTNGGANFFSINFGINNNWFMKITLSAFNENLILVGCSEIGQETFYRSDDGGASWIFVDYNGLMFTNYTIEDIVFSTNYENVVYLASRGNNTDCNNGIGIYKSTDYGVNWKSKNNGLLNCQMFSIGIESSPLTIGEYIYASNFGNIYKSVDGGESWILKHIVNQGMIKDFEIKGDNIYGAVQDICPFLFEPLGVIKSSDNGESWSYMRNGILSLTAFAISSEIQNDCIWVGGNFGGFYKSTDYGNSFNENTLRSLKVSTQVLIANDNNIIATGSFSTRFNKSTDYGNTWISILNDCGEIYGYDIEADNNFTNLLSTQNGEEGVINGYILKSSNSGLNWYTVLSADDPLATARFRDIEIDPYNQSTVYMCGSRNYEVRKSTDLGESWETSLQVNSLFGFYSLAIDKYSYSGGECKNIYVGGYSCPYNIY